MTEKVQAAFEQLQTTFKTGKTKTLEWRRNKLRALEKGMKEMTAEISAAVSKDHRRKEAEVFGSEIGPMIEAIRHVDSNLESYMADIPEKAELILAPATCSVRYEPLGVVGVYGSWNFPVLLAVKPVIYAIAAGNCVLLKPSEVSKNASAVVKRMFD